MYEQVSQNIQENIEKINELLSKSAVDSEVVKQEEKIMSCLTVSHDDLFENKSFDGFYDLDKVSKIFEMLEISKSQDLKKKKKILSRLQSAESMSSLSPRSTPKSTPSLSSASSLCSASSLSRIDDITQVPESASDVKSCLSEIRSLLEEITKTSLLKVPDLTKIQRVEASKSMKLIDLFTKLQKLSKDLQNVVASDSVKEEMPEIDDHFIGGLQRVAQALADVTTANSNDIALVPKPENCSFHLTKAVHEILEAIEKYH